MIDKVLTNQMLKEEQDASTIPDRGTDQVVSGEQQLPGTENH